MTTAPAFKRETRDQHLRAPETMLIGSRHFSARWKSRPIEEVCVGVRPLSGADDDVCRAEASKIAWRAFPGTACPHCKTIIATKGDAHEVQRTDVFNDALMRIAIARATCDPNDATRPTEIWQGVPEEAVQHALTREGVKAIYDRIEIVTKALSPVQAPATDEEIDLLFAVLHDRMSEMPESRAARVRRVLGWLLEECRAYDPVDDTTA